MTSKTVKKPIAGKPTQEGEMVKGADAPAIGQVAPADILSIPIQQLVKTTINVGERDMDNINEAIAEVLMLKPVYTKAGRQKIMIRYRTELGNRIYTFNAFYGKVWLSMLAENLAGKINTLNDLLNKKVKLIRQSMVVAGRKVSKLIPVEIVA
jgi:hypothetical protein